MLPEEHKKIKFFHIKAIGKKIKFLLRDMRKPYSGPCADVESCMEKMSNMAFSKTKEKSEPNLLLVDY